MASKFSQTSTVTVTEPTVTKAPAKPVASPVPTPVPAVESNGELEKRVEALEKKVEDLIARLSRKMSF